MNRLQELSSQLYASQRMGREEFYAQVRKASFFDTWRRLTRQRCDLVRFDDVVRWRSRQLRCPPQLTHVPIGNIVGSVGRANDFTRDFLPRASVSGERWVSIERATQQGIELPPLELYQVGDVYFVIDGHHRTSVARLHGAHSIDAVVKTLESPVWFTLEDFQNEGWVEKVSWQEGGSQDGTFK